MLIVQISCGNSLSILMADFWLVYTFYWILPEFCSTSRSFTELHIFIFRVFCGGWSRKVSSQAADVVQEKGSVLFVQSMTPSLPAPLWVGQTANTLTSSLHTLKSSVPPSLFLERPLWFFLQDWRGPWRPSCFRLTDGRRWRSRVSGWRGWSCLQVREHTVSLQS